MKIDRIDLKILDWLQQDARIPTTRLAERIGLTAAPTSDRIRRLERDGLLRSYRANLAVECLPPLSHLLVSVALTNHRVRDSDRFEAAIMQAPEVIACWAVGGDVNYILHVVVNRLSNERAAVERIIGADIGVHEYRVLAVGRSIKPFVGLPLQQLVSTHESTIA